MFCHTKSVKFLCDILDRDVKAKLISDAMFKLEHSIEDKQKAKRAAPTINQIKNIRDEWEDDYAISQVLRKKFREEKREISRKKVRVFFFIRQFNDSYVASAGRFLGTWKVCLDGVLPHDVTSSRNSLRLELQRACDSPRCK